MSQQKQEKGFFGAISSLFQSKDKSKDSDCCSISFEEIEEAKEIDQEAQSKETTNNEVKTNDHKGGCCN